MGAYVYFDGFNFYYRLFKNSNRKHRLPNRFKWLDLLKLSNQLVPGQSIDWIGYFTANVNPNPSDPTQHLRQQAYISALRTLAPLEVVLGLYQQRIKRAVPIGCRTCGGTGVRVNFQTYEEKGSDVNIAARLVRDAALGSFTEAVVVSNDSDLEEAIRVATQDFGRIVHVLSPDLFVIGALSRVATTAAPLDTSLFKQCEFPITLTTPSGGTISRPTTWVP